MPHGFIRVHSRATRGDDGLRRSDVAENLVLHLNEPLRAACIDELLQRLVALALDDEVGVNEIVVHDLRQHDAQRRLSRAGHADKHDVVFCRHDSSLLFARARQRADLYPSIIAVPRSPTSGSPFSFRTSALFRAPSPPKPPSHSRKSPCRLSCAPLPPDAPLACCGASRETPQQGHILRRVFHVKHPARKAERKCARPHRETRTTCNQAQLASALDSFPSRNVSRETSAAHPAEHHPTCAGHRRSGRAGITPHLARPREEAEAHVLRGPSVRREVFRGTSGTLRDRPTRPRPRAVYRERRLPRQTKAAAHARPRAWHLRAPRGSPARPRGCSPTRSPTRPRTPPARATRFARSPARAPA